MELHRFFRYAIEKMCKEKKSLNHFNVLFIELDVKMHQNTMNAGYFAFNFMLYSLNVS